MARSQAGYDALPFDVPDNAEHFYQDLDEDSTLDVSVRYPQLRVRTK